MHFSTSLTHSWLLIIVRLVRDLNGVVRTLSGSSPLSLAARRSADGIKVLGIGHARTQLGCLGRICQEQIVAEDSPCPVILQN